MKKIMLFLVSTGLLFTACQDFCQDIYYCQCMANPASQRDLALEEMKVRAEADRLRAEVEADKAEALAAMEAEKARQAAMEASNTPIAVGEAEISLPKPLPVKATLTETLQKRRSIRSYTDQMISLEQLSGLLWSANGVNRDNGMRTAPSARNQQSVSLFVTFEKAAYRYDHTAHKIIRVAEGDLRPVKAAPVELIVTSAFPDSELIQGIDAGVVSENAALYSAAEDLATVIRMMRGDQSELQKALGMEPNNRPLFNMAVGYEAK